MNSIIIQVAKENGVIRTINEALEEAKKYEGQAVIIEIGEGVYKEKIEVKQDNISFIGTNPDKVVLTYDDYANALMPDGEKRGTFRSYSVLIDASDFTAKNITFENSAGEGRHVGQAIALYVDGDRNIFDNCRLLGSQDTLFTGPLPAKELQKNGFKGPKEFAPRIQGKHYFKNCYICGDVDFIFGSAVSYFEGCEIFSCNRDSEVNGYITAASTPEDKEYGYIFNNCRFTSNCAPSTVYLGRPWRDHARVIIMNSVMDAHIKKEGWHNWNKPDAEGTSYYGEYNNRGEGAITTDRVPWSKQMNDGDVKELTPNKVLGDWIGR